MILIEKKKYYVIDRNKEQISYEGKIINHKNLLSINYMYLYHGNDDIGDNYE